MDDTQKNIMSKTKAFLLQYKGLEQQKRRLVQQFLEEIHEIGDASAIEKIDDMLNNL